MVVSIEDEYRRKGEFYLRLAASATDPVGVAGLRALAADYFELAQSGDPPAVQQQQQIQPKIPKSEEN
jgi:hypothetical protein